jgi:hypothetical protein
LVYNWFNTGSELVTGWSLTGLTPVEVSAGGNCRIPLILKPLRLTSSISLYPSQEEGITPISSLSSVLIR